MHEILRLNYSIYLHFKIISNDNKNFKVNSKLGPDIKKLNLKSNAPHFTIVMLYVLYNLGPFLPKFPNSPIPPLNLFSPLCNKQGCSKSHDKLSKLGNIH